MSAAKPPLDDAPVPLAPKRFIIPLTKRQERRRLRGTRAERAILRFYFLSMKLSEDDVDGAMARWSYATNRREFDALVKRALTYFERVIPVWEPVNDNR